MTYIIWPWPHKRTLRRIPARPLKKLEGIEKVQCWQSFFLLGIVARFARKQMANRCSSLRSLISFFQTSRTHKRAKRDSFPFYASVAGMSYNFYKLPTLKRCSKLPNISWRMIIMIERIRLIQILILILFLFLIFLLFFVEKKLYSIKKYFFLIKCFRQKKKKF